MPEEISRDQIRRAFRLLFGPQMTFSDDVLNYIQPSGIKSAFRAQVKLKHPDLADREERSPGEMTEEFRTLYDAYRLLMELKSRRFRRTEPPDTASPPRTGTENRDFFYQGTKVPPHHMRLGEFLFYSKVISWQTLIQAIIFKKQFDDRLMGRYFIEKSFLSEPDLHRYLALQKAHNQKFKKT